MTQEQLNLTATDVIIFVPALDYDQSLRFYTLLGWEIKWQADDGKLTILELDDSRFYLQNYYVEDWANNFMFQVNVEDATAWHTHVSKIIEAENFDYARLRPPKKQDWGAIVTHVWDPSGVLIHFTQLVTD